MLPPLLAVLPPCCSDISVFAEAASFADAAICRQMPPIRSIFCFADAMYAASSRQRLSFFFSPLSFRHVHADAAAPPLPRRRRRKPPAAEPAAACRHPPRFSRRQLDYAAAAPMPPLPTLTPSRYAAA